jgi:alpha-glucoside transport system substrate-binding protein
VSLVHELPVGTVTFLFTDIEGSTQLLKQLRDHYGGALEEHQRILREAFAEHGGHEVDTQGDSFFVAFARAKDAVAAAIACQRRLGAHAWPDDRDLRVRMGIHTGEPSIGGERYVGVGVHRAARVGAVGHGGQILLSNATRELVEDDLSPQTRLRDLGSYRLKDVDRPEHLFQVEAEGLQRKFPPLAARRVSGPRRVRRLLVVAAALTAAATAAIAFSYATKESPVGSADNPITIATTWTENDPEHKALVEVLRTFEQTTGLQAEFQPLHVSDSSEIRGRLEADSPMVVLVPSPGVLADLARRGIVKPLSSLGITEDSLRQSYGKAWVDLAAVDGDVYGFPAKANSKSLLWYRPEDFQRMRLSVPKTWTQLVSVTMKIKLAGETPWALAGSEPWTLTDWFENVYINTAGPYKYDALFAGKLRFDDPSVMAALRRMSTTLSNDYIAGGTSGALRASLRDALISVFGPEPRAHLYMEGGFVGNLALAYMKPTPKPGRTIAATPFPRIDLGVGRPIVVGADFIAPLATGQAIRRLFLYLSSPGAGRIWVSTGAIVSPHKGVGSSAYPNALVRTEARQLTNAQVVRFDGSDLLPGSLGAELGSALQRVIEDPPRANKLMKAFQRKAGRVFAAA